jgi:hypothetical protein
MRFGREAEKPRAMLKIGARRRKAGNGGRKAADEPVDLRVLVAVRSKEKKEGAEIWGGIEIRPKRE